MPATWASPLSVTWVRARSIHLICEAIGFSSASLSSLNSLLTLSALKRSSGVSCAIAISEAPVFSTRPIVSFTSFSIAGSTFGASALATVPAAFGRLPRTWLAAARAFSSGLNSATVPVALAPLPIQKERRAVSCSVSCSLSSGGMCSSSLIGRKTRWRRGLSSTLPATTAGPSLPPLRIASTETMLNLPLGFSVPWHLLHFASSTGATRSL